jgi:hypothetical protein
MMDYIDVSSYPYPIASAYDEFRALHEVDKGKQFRAAIRAFTSVLKYCSATIIAEYVAYLDAGGKGDPVVGGLLHSHLMRPSLGQWNNFLRDLLKWRRTVERDISGLIEALDLLYYKNRKSEKLAEAAKIINQLIETRNEYFHPGIDPVEGDLQIVLDSTALKLNRLMELVAPLNEYALLYRTRDNRLLQMIGPQLESFPVLSDVTCDLQTGMVGLETGVGSVLPMCFLSEAIYDQGGKVVDFMLLETARVSKNSKKINLIKYILGNRLAYDTERYLENANNFRDKLALEVERKEKDLQGDLTWEMVTSRQAEAIAKRDFLSENDGKKFIREIYVERSAFGGAGGVFEKFLEQQKYPCLVFTGDSGHGKTNLMLREVLKRRGGAGTVSFFFEGRNILMEGLARSFENGSCTLPLLAQYLKNGDNGFSDKRVIIFIDAINEYHNPPGLLGEVLEFCSDVGPNNLRFVLSCRSLSWARLQPGLKDGQLAKIYRDSDCEDFSVPTLGAFSNEELATAFSLYQSHFGIKTGFDELSPRSLHLLRDPLMLRLVCDSDLAEEGHLPAELDTSRIFTLFEKHHKVSENYDRPFLRELIRTMWEYKSASLSEDVIRRNSQLERIVFESPIAMPSHLTKICAEKDCRAILKKGEGGFTGHVCTNCDSPDLVNPKSDWRTTFERLLDEGILTQDDKGDWTALRFVYDRHFEYRMARWLLEQEPGEADTSEGAALSIERARDLVSTVGKGHLDPILLEAIKHAIIMARNQNEIIGTFARSEDETFRSMAVACLTERSKLGLGASKEHIAFIKNLASSGPATRLVAIEAVLEAPQLGDEPLLMPVADKDSADQLVLALGQAIYRIWRSPQAGGYERAQTVMEELRTQLSKTNLVRGRIDPFAHPHGRHGERPGNHAR